MTVRGHVAEYGQNALLVARRFSPDFCSQGGAKLGLQGSAGRHRLVKPPDLSIACGLPGLTLARQLTKCGQIGFVCLRRMNQAAPCCNA